MATIADKLNKLYRLAVLRPEEQGNEARENEARSAAFLLLKLAHESGYQLRFAKRAQEPEPKVAAGPAPSGPRTQGYARYEPPPPPTPPKKKAPTVCVCGKPVANRTWYAPGVGCTHVWP